ncbi:Uncharacterised protein [uncultured archaeon]|nr:Uncharacterised protein [uncultured archaeon]
MVKIRKYVEVLNVKVSREQRATIEALAERKELSIGEATRQILDLGIKGLKC